MSKIVNVESEEQFNTVTKEGTVLVDFWAPWCGPCRMIAPVMDELAEEGYTIVKVNTDEHNGLASNLGIRSIPTVMIFHNGELVASEAGAKSKASFADLINKYKA